MGIINAIEGMLHPAPSSSTPTTTSVTGKPIVTVALLTALGAHNPADWAPVLHTACSTHGIDTPLRVAAFLANVMVETASLSTLSENLNYTPQALLAQWGSHFTEAEATADGRTAEHAADQEAIADAAYDGRMGNSAGSDDGWIFRGSGGLETTGRANFEALARTIGWTRPLEDLPAYVQTREGAATSAAIYWQAHACNVPADRRDIASVRRIVNGGTIGLVAVQARYAAACRALGIH